MLQLKSVKHKKNINKKDVKYKIKYQQNILKHKAIYLKISISKRKKNKN